MRNESEIGVQGTDYLLLVTHPLLLVTGYSTLATYHILSAEGLRQKAQGLKRGIFPI